MVPGERLIKLTETTQWNLLFSYFTLLPQILTRKNLEI